MNAPLIIYHANCRDGFTAAWVVYSWLRDNGLIAGLHEAHYSTRVPREIKDREVFVVDFCYSLDEMREIATHAKRLTLIDHHKTAEATANALRGLPNTTVYFGLHRSGAGLAWEFLYPNRPAPWIVSYVEDRDLWKHQLVDSRVVNAFLSTQPFEMDVWNRMAKFPTHEWTVPAGTAVVQAEEAVIAAHVRNARKGVVAGHTVPIVNATCYYSEIAGRLAEGHPFAVAYFDRKDGKRQFSLRSSKDGVDVSEIAKKFGGGGHTHAAGFETGAGHDSDYWDIYIADGRIA